MLRELRPDLRIGFFLHIPFPPAELFQQLPWRRQLLEGLLGADVVGFQRPGASQNFVRLVRQRVGHKTHRDHDLPARRPGRAGRVLPDLDRHHRAWTSSPAPRPSSSGPRRSASSSATRGRVLLGIDRLDYTKGIYDRLRAFGELVRDGEISVSRTRSSCRSRPRRASGSSSTAGSATRSTGSSAGSTATSARIGSPPIHYLHNSYPKEEMAALFRAADVMVVTPLRDGMNLVAKEYVACRYDDQGALVLSEFAGAADELRQAFMVNPYDINGMKAAIVTAMEADPKDLSRRMKAMRKTVAEHDVKRLGPQVPRGARRRAAAARQAAAAVPEERIRRRVRPASSAVRAMQTRW